MGIADFISGIFGGGSQGAANIPARSPEEERLAGLQADALTRSMKLQDLLMPYQLSQLGLTPSFDASGNLTGVSEGPQAAALRGLSDQYTQFATEQLRGQMANAPAAAQIQQLYNTRTLAALRGELPVDPALTQSLMESERDLRNTLRSQIGTGYETSSPGIEAMSKFGLNKNILLEAARRGDLSTSQAMGLNQAGSNYGMGINSSDLSARLRGMNLSEIMGLPGGFLPGANAVNAPMYLSNQMRLGTGQLAQKSQEFNTNMGMDIFSDIVGAGTRLFGGPKVPNLNNTIGLPT